MPRVLLLLFLTASLVGCGSITHPLPKCDGYSRRPLNRSMWQWEGDSNQSTTGAVTEPTSSAASLVKEPASVTPAAFAQFDVPRSYSPCEAQ